MRSIQARTHDTHAKYRIVEGQVKVECAKCHHLESPRDMVQCRITLEDVITRGPYAGGWTKYGNGHFRDYFSVKDPKVQLATVCQECAE